MLYLQSLHLFILGLAIGKLASRKIFPQISNPLKFFAFIQIGIGTYGVLLLPVFSSLPPNLFGNLSLVLPNQILFFIVQILLSILLISIPAILMGTTLPIMIVPLLRNSNQLVMMLEN